MVRVGIRVAVSLRIGVVLFDVDFYMDRHIMCL